LISIHKIFEELRLEISQENVGSTKRYKRIAGILISFACTEAFSSGFYGKSLCQGLKNIYNQDRL